MLTLSVMIYVSLGSRALHQVGPNDMPVFSKVVGPITALLASLASFGWKARTFELWEDHTGCARLVRPSTLVNIGELFQELVLQVLWIQTAKHHCGGGLEAAHPDNVSFQLAASLSKKCVCVCVCVCVCA